MNIKRIKSLKITKKLTSSLNGNTTGQRILAFVVYFLLFTIILSVGIFTSKLNIQLGEPSPQLIRAPWAKDIEDLQKYREDQKRAYDETDPIYQRNEEVLTNITVALNKSFLALNDSIESGESTANRIKTLRQTPPFDKLSEDVLTSLLEASPELLREKEDIARATIIGVAQDTSTGARNMDEIPWLQDEIKRELRTLHLPDEFNTFLNAFVAEVIITPTLVEDVEATEKLRQKNMAAVQLEVYRYKAGQKIVGPGEIVDEHIMQVLAHYGLVQDQSPMRVITGISLIVLTCMGLFVIFIYQYRRNRPRITSKAVLIGLVVTLVLLFGKVIIGLNLGNSEYNALTGFLIPVAWATITIAILVEAEVAFLTAGILGVFIAVLVDPTLASSHGFQMGVVAAVGGIIGVHSVSQLSQRSDLARAGIYVAAANTIVISAIALITEMPLGVWAMGVLLGIVNGLASSALAVGTLHWFESAFGITSAVRLLEFSNPNRPLLKKLLMEAPGTYNHSILVANLAEAAAEVVQADPILVRVGAMYHDIGKLKRPYFFIENQFALENPHDKIAPSLSALIITSHIKDGLEMAREHKLPEGIQDIIAQHHGDSLVGYFYHKALEENQDIPIEAFQYEGPKPQSKEAVLVMLADSVEAAVRALKQPTPGRIEGLVRKIIKDKLNDDQLSQSNLTFQDLDKIATVFVKVLSGIFHSRIEYPDLPHKHVHSENVHVNTDKEKEKNKEQDKEDKEEGKEQDKEECKKEKVTDAIPVVANPQEDTKANDP